MIPAASSEESAVVDLMRNDKACTLTCSSSSSLTYFLAAGYFASVLAAVLGPSRIVLGISGPGYTMAAPGPGLVPDLSTLPQSCAAWRTKGSGFAQPLILEAMLRMRSVAEAPTPPQSSQAER